MVRDYQTDIPQRIALELIQTFSPGRGNSPLKLLNFNLMKTPLSQSFYIKYWLSQPNEVREILKAQLLKKGIRISALFTIIFLWSCSARLYDYSGSLYITRIGSDTTCQVEELFLQYTIDGMEAPIRLVSDRDTVISILTYSQVDFNWFDSERVVVLGSQQDRLRGFLLSIRDSTQTIVVGTKCNP
jgi:hypothetical protein